MQLFRKLLFRRNHGNRRCFDAGEAEPVFSLNNVQGFEHFVADTDVHMKARKLPSIQSCFYGISPSAFRRTV